MKNSKKLLASLSLALFSLTGFGQTNSPNAQIEVTSVTIEKDRIVVSITSDEPFIFGARRYALHVGDKYYVRSIHPEGNMNALDFLIDKKDSSYILSTENKPVLVYGLNPENVASYARQKVNREEIQIVGPHRRLNSIKNSSIIRK